jgi:hypothetical protein
MSTKVTVCPVDGDRIEQILGDSVSLIVITQPEAPLRLNMHPYPGIRFSSFKPLRDIAHPGL